MLDAGVAPRAPLDKIVGVVAHVAAVENGVLGGANVDEGSLHAGQDVLHATEIDVAVDLGRVVGGTGDVMLDQRPAFEHADLGGVRPVVHDHQVAADGTALALAAPAAFEYFLVDLHGAR